MINFSCFNQSFSRQIRSFFRFFLFHVNPFWIQLSYFIIVSIFGHLALMVSKPRTARFRPNDSDVFFTSVSATTVTSMSTIEMEVMDGLNLYQKVVGSLFQTVNSRRTGESVFGLSSISAILVLFVVMMYLPPYTTCIPPNVHVHEEFPKNGKQSQNRKNTFMECLIFSQLSYLAIFIILICITERQKMEEDPLNFNVLNVTIEVISAYGNVGFTTKYSCKRQLKPDSLCVDTWYGFVGR
ncbi:cation transporter HKT8-like [Quercus lobata]|uniref:cation transporter HKT8-like n=1 Tax=Quercus lobata TaxID=97700 RepID=UPI00124611D6|nr:cation transporter HKT8-like [Quercus lobata]